MILNNNKIINIQYIMIFLEDNLMKLNLNNNKMMMNMHKKKIYKDNNMMMMMINKDIKMKYNMIINNKINNI